MQQVGNMLLARAVLTKYHHAHIGGGYQPYAVQDFLKGGNLQRANIGIRRCPA